MKRTLHILLALIGFISLSAQAEANITAKQSEVIQSLISKFAVEAKKDDAKSIFSADAGKKFYLWRRTYGKRDVSCSACHTENPASTGIHNETKKPIKPLAPAVNPDRFADAELVEKSMTNHCQDLFRNDCTAQQKGDFLTYLITVK
jgi:Domain of unknown function (DUF1924)